MASFTRPPVVSVDPSLTSATVSWETDLNTFGQVFYGTNPTAYSGQEDDFNFGTVHSVLLPNLAPNQDYACDINALDANGVTLVSSGQVSFRTALAAPPAIEDGPFSDPDDDSADISWIANVDGVGVVTMGTESTNLNLQFQDPTVSRDHALTCGGLSPGTQYHYCVSNLDPATGVTIVQSPVVAFTTEAPVPLGARLGRPQANPRRVRRGQTTVISVRLRLNGNPVVGKKVMFEVMGGPGAFEASQLPTGPKAQVGTDATGFAQVILRAGNVRGIVRVRITSTDAVNRRRLCLLVRR